MESTGGDLQIRVPDDYVARIAEQTDVTLTRKEASELLGHEKDHQQNVRGLIEHVCSVFC